ncbi:hypothetical protein ASPWEDRAFT_619105 [Aspergillus wentii DTO 134E9]|uniref:F-box domain-containing protein n=1 Tax=Aspergillus wentii DTO 134E9 TaxID=1073089 RepID=A0A1L9REL7_ASPWE|nr:uncharacterized protein ASPWEDRAFT_619105 [Aspergillus wentii DTO 134E9]OJJ33317.1 hypothetical protein ASPWEDRAFT_619105 [Aspergillus wentii DTO 134E9]
MSQDFTPAALLIPELLELILLSVDMQTLLTSQRVCRLWHNLINISKPLQKALFFLPIELNPNTARKTYTRNPLIRKILWPNFICSTPLSESTRYLDKYQRKEASWRRMLMQQPPTSIIGILEYYPPKRGRWYSKISVKKTGDHLRMGVLCDPILGGVLRPCPKPWLFGDQPRLLGLLKVYWQDCEYLLHHVCDVVIFVSSLHSLFSSEGLSYGQTSPERWLEGLQRAPTEYDIQALDRFPLDCNYGL